jgi:uncharacterized protein YkwD
VNFVRTFFVCALLAGFVLLPAADASAKHRVGPTLIAHINKVRAHHHLRPLRVNRALLRSSRRYACRMIRAGRFGHASGVSAPHRFSPRGEALALTSSWRRRWRSALSGWWHSPPHRAILLGRHYRYIGVGSCKGHLGGGRSMTWVVHTGG